MADVFISYSHHDAARVAPIAQALTAVGLSVWYDPSLKPGEVFDEKIASEMEVAKAIIVCWSVHSVKSKWVKSEANFADDQGLMVPVRLDECKLPHPFSAVHREDLIGWAGDADHTGWRKILSRLGELVGRPGLLPLSDARASQDPLRLKVWAEEYPDDPVAGGAADRWKEDERRTFEVQLAEARKDIESYFRQRQSTTKAALTRCEKAFDVWIKSSRDSNVSDRPNPRAIVSDLITPVNGEAVAAAMKRAEAAESEVSRLTEALAAAPPPQKGWSAGQLAATALLMLITAGGGYFGALRMRPIDPTARVEIEAARDDAKQASILAQTADQRRNEAEGKARMLEQQNTTLQAQSTSATARIATLESELKAAEAKAMVAMSSGQSSTSGGTLGIASPPAVAPALPPGGATSSSSGSLTNSAVFLSQCTRLSGHKLDRDNASRDGQDDVNDLTEAQMREAIGVCNKALAGLSGTDLRRALAQLGRVQAGFAVMKAKQGDMNLAQSAMRDARNSWQQAAQAGSALAMNQYGAFYDGSFSREVDRSNNDLFGPRDQSAAIRYWRAAADNGFPPALSNMAAMMLNRNGPVPIDASTAVRYIDQAIATGFPRAFIVKADGLMTGLIEPGLSTGDRRRLAAMLAQRAWCAGETRAADEYFNRNNLLNPYRPSGC